MAGEPEQTSLVAIAKLFLRLGLLGFGGPAAHIALMRDELVDRRHWIDDRRFMNALGVTNLIPGPNSSELAIHMGYMLGGLRGAMTAGISFALPAVVIMTGFSAAYFAVGGFPIRSDLFAGLQPVVIAVIAVTLWRLRSAISTMLTGSVAFAAIVLTVWLPGLEPLWLLGGGILTWVAWRFSSESSAGAFRRDGTLTLVAWPAGATALVAVVRRGAGVIGVTGLAALPLLAWVFFKTGALLFGGGYVLIPLLEPEVVGRGWLTKAEFLDGIALGQATPGPIVTTSAFVGYGVAGIWGALVATVAIYLPAFVAVMAGTGPFLRTFTDRPAVRAVASGINAAALGAIAGAGVILGRVALASPLRVVIGAAALLALFVRVPVWLVLLGGASAALLAGVLS